MITVTSKLAGLDRLKARLTRLSAAGREAARDGLDEIAALAAEEARLSLAGATDVPSQAGAIPADPDARIQAAIRVEPDPAGGASLVVALPFARDLEFGTSRMAARPFLRPAVAHAGQGATAVLARHLAVALKEAPS